MKEVVGIVSRLHGQPLTYKTLLGKHNVMKKLNEDYASFTGEPLFLFPDDGNYTELKKLSLDAIEKRWRAYIETYSREFEMLN